MINAVGCLSGITGAMITSVAKNVTGDVNSGTYMLGGCLPAGPLQTDSFDSSSHAVHQRPD